MLLLSAVRLAMLDRQGMQQIHESRSENALEPPDGSLDGIDGEGKRRTPEIDTNGQLQGKGYLLVFVIHRRYITDDVQFWNKVISGMNKIDPKSTGRTQYWGICDDGSSCDSYQPAAHFHIFGYLDPYQMHTVARTDLRHQTLLYDHSMMLKAHIDRSSDPLTQSRLILQQTNE
jgi:hypothetical protein